MKYSENRQAKIIIVDDHPVLRQGVSMLINQEPEMVACCQAGDIDQAMKANRACAHDLAIVDLSLFGISGMELIRQFQGKYPDLAILVMSMHDETIYAERVLKAGAKGYLMKHEGTDTILHAIRQVLDGEHYVSDRMRSKMIKQIIQGEKEESPIRNLSANEFEVLRMIGKGLDNNEVAIRLSRSVKTVESHRANIKKKLNLSSGSELTFYAFNWVREHNDISL